MRDGRFGVDHVFARRRRFVGGLAYFLWHHIKAEKQVQQEGQS